ncbi:MAG: lytic murein transglycosylase [Deltaproteobacteria bacterium]|nr:lytic murein transglycosylase [Deltaproteobacteria bacterium]MBW1970261.1 lytic murein transglycosylase [Deltaproteobacteria bacterium]MBW2326926.1 lytic murein transglycosylase [Deltaproteobacteria bacterium]
MRQNKMTWGQYIAFFFSFLILNSIVLPQNAGGVENNHPFFESLQKRLISDGFDPARIIELYNRSGVYFEGKGVSRFLVHRESRLNYDQFAGKKSIKRALKYMETHRAALERTEKEYGVDKEIITAILLVETRLGTFLGGPSILNTLSTIAALADPDVRDMFWKNISKSKEVTREQLDKWVGRKSTWAYNELKAFLTYTAQVNMDPTEVSGSYSGAMGIAQFMPSNVIIFARDGDGDGRIDVFNHADAITSIASYLKHYGWHPGIDRQKAYKVIYHYNHSSQYVKTILKVSDLLKPKT